MGNLFDDLFGGDKEKLSFVTVPQSEGATESRKRLEDLAFGDPPDVPRQQIAPLPEMTEERGLARTTAKELAQPTDFMALPEVQGIIQEARVTGDLLANRLSRMLQSSGNLTSTTGRDVLGRAVTDVQKSLASSLAPFASEERGRRERLIPTLENLGLTEEDRQRAITQAELNALFQQEFAESGQIQNYTIPLLESIINLQPGQQPLITGAKPSILSQAAPIIGMALGGYLAGPAGAGAGGMPTVGTVTPQAGATMARF